jgi:hypothetical protein
MWQQVLCERCSKLANGAMIPAVEDFTQKLQAQVCVVVGTGPVMWSLLQDMPQPWLPLGILGERLCMHTSAAM